MVWASSSLVMWVITGALSLTQSVITFVWGDRAGDDLRSEHVVSIAIAVVRQIPGRSIAESPAMPLPDRA